MNMEGIKVFIKHSSLQNDPVAADQAYQAGQNEILTAVAQMTLEKGDIKLNDQIGQIFEQIENLLRKTDGKFLENQLTEVIDSLFVEVTQYYYCEGFKNGTRFGSEFLS